MENVLPEGSWLPRPFRRVEICFGEPVFFEGILERLRSSGKSDDYIRAEITRILALRLGDLESQMNENRSLYYLAKK